MRPVAPVRHLFRGLTVAAAALCLSGVASAKPVPLDQQIDRTEPAPARLKGIDVSEHLGDVLPQSVPFVDETGHPTTFGSLFDGKHPVILTLNYSRCPMLCSLELNGLVAALKQLDWAVGEEFRIATVVLDPKETPAQAKESQGRYLRQYGAAKSPAGDGRKGPESGWTFLTGSDTSIRRIADAVGFSFGFNEKRDEYIHPASIILLSPDGRVSRYLYGIEYDPKTLRLSLVEASQGKIGTTIDQLVLYCFHYDAKEGGYAPVAMNIMRVSSGAGATLLGGVLTSFWLAESRRKKKSQSDDESSRSSPS